MLVRNTHEYITFMYAWKFGTSERRKVISRRIICQSIWNPTSRNRNFRNKDEYSWFCGHSICNWNFWGELYENLKCGKYKNRVFELFICRIKQVSLVVWVKNMKNSSKEFRKELQNIVSADYELLDTIDCEMKWCVIVENQKNNFLGEYIDAIL